MTRVPDWLIEKVHLGEASDGEKSLVLGDPDARSRLEQLPALDRAFLQAYPAHEEIRRIQDRARIAAAQRDTGPNRGPNRATLASILLAPLLTGAIAIALVGTPTVPDLDGREPTTIKGQSKPMLRVYRQRSSGIERLGAGAVAREGDLLQLGVVRATAEHGVVVSVDGRGSVTLHWPTDPTLPTTLGSAEVQLPNGYELDDAPSFERFFLVTTGDSPPDVSAVVHAAEALAATGEARFEPLALPTDYAQSSFVVRKETR